MAMPAEKLDAFEPIDLDDALIEIAVTASARAWGDDPKRVMAAPKGSRFRRSITGAAAALHDATGIALTEICGALNATRDTIHTARCIGKAGFKAGAGAALLAIVAELNARGIVPDGRADYALTHYLGQNAPRSADVIAFEPRQRAQSVDPWELAFVRERRAASVPWPHIGRQLGRNAETLRARYEELIEGRAHG